MSDLYRSRGKRLFDLIGAFSCLVVTGPIQAAAALGIRRQLGSPVLFRQSRPGMGGREFQLLKLRSMRSIGPVEDPLVSDADRLTDFGKWIRATSIDELPALWNVLRGDMSLVGPRPLLPEYLPLYSTEQARRHEVRPGVTGWAQVNGRNEISWEEKLALDVWYVDHVSFTLDLRILLRTIGVVLGRRGISAKGHATTSRFLGHSSQGP